MNRVLLSIVFAALISVSFSQSASAEGLTLAKVYRDYPGYIEPPSCINPRMAPSYLKQPAATVTQPAVTQPAGETQPMPILAEKAPHRRLAGHPYSGAWAGFYSLSSSDMDNAAVALDLDYDNGYAGGLLLGYDFGSMRVDIEGSYRGGSVDRIAVNGIDAAVTTGDLNIKALMLNGYYDFLVGANTTPYLGAGLGWAEVSFDAVGANSLLLVNDSDTVLAGQLSAGVLFDLNRSTVLDLGYRYLATGKPNLASSYGDFKTDVASHTLVVGLQFNF